jgi:hypothetical protein
MMDFLQIPILMFIVGCVAIFTILVLKAILK